MDLTSLIWLIAVAGAAAYVQTLTGFAFGLLTMGVIGLLGIIPLPDAAVIVSILTLFNAVQVLLKGWRDVAWPEFRLIIGPALLSVFLGYFLLEYLAGTNLDGLRLFLGVVVIAGATQLALKPQPLQNRSSSASFMVAGALGGFLGGMFSTAGPPLVYHLYRQPLPAAAIRETLVLVFAINALLRLGIVGVAGKFPQGGAWWALLAIPSVMGFTYVAKRWPPPLSPLALRRAAFFLLLLSGLSLAVPASINLIGVYS